MKTNKFRFLNSHFFPYKTIILSLLSTFYSLLLCGCITSEYNVATHTQDLIFFSTEREITMGKNISKQIAKEFTLSNNPYDIERMERIAKKLIEVIDRRELNYYFYIIEEDDQKEKQINAFSVPGGYVYIYKDLFDLLNDDELAFVLAHEVGHIVSRHHIKRLQAAMGYNFLVVVSTKVPADAQFARGVSFALAQIMMAYSREDELNADELAVKYCSSAGFNPLSGIEVMNKLYQVGKKKIRPLSYFRSHPYHSHRVRRIKEVLRLPLAVDDYIND